MTNVVFQSPGEYLGGGRYRGCSWDIYRVSRWNYQAVEYLLTDQGFLRTEVRRRTRWLAFKWMERRVRKWQKATNAKGWPI